MNIRSRKLTSLLLAGSILATGAVGLGASSALAHDNGGSTTAATRQHRDGHRAPAAVTAAVKKLLNVDDATLKSARTAGKSLTTLAQEKGVSRADLVDTIAAALKANKPADAPTRTDAQLSQMAGRIADQVPGAKGDRGPGRNDAGRQAVGNAIATTLGITTAELKAAHEAGTTPATLAQQKGVARDTLVAAVVTALKANKPADAPALTDAQLTQMAGHIVDGVHPAQGPGGPGAHRR